MLKIRRRLNEQIQIGLDVTMTVASLSSRTVALRFDGPETPRILRKELYDQLVAKQGHGQPLNKLERAMDKMLSDARDSGPASDTGAPMTSND